MDTRLPTFMFLVPSLVKYVIIDACVMLYVVCICMYRVVGACGVIMLRTSICYVLVQDWFYVFCPCDLVLASLCHYVATRHTSSTSVPPLSPLPLPPSLHPPIHPSYTPSLLTCSTHAHSHRTHQESIC